MSTLTKKTIKAMKKVYPTVKDFAVIDVSDSQYAVLLDKNDKAIQAISERELTKFVNEAEGVQTVTLKGKGN